MPGMILMMAKIATRRRMRSLRPSLMDSKKGGLCTLGFSFLAYLMKHSNENSEWFGSTATKTYNYFLLELASTEVSGVTHNAALDTTKRMIRWETRVEGGDDMRGRENLHRVWIGAWWGCLRLPCALWKAGKVGWQRLPRDWISLCKRACQWIQNQRGWERESTETYLSWLAEILKIEVLFCAEAAPSPPNWLLAENMLWVVSGLKFLDLG